MSLVATRERRANAGNRMRALLDEELELDEMFREVDDDAEFEAHGEEEDVVDSDFDASSGDEEAAKEAEGAAEDQAIHVEEKRKRKVVVPERKKRPPPKPRPQREALSSAAPSTAASTPLATPTKRQRTERTFVTPTITPATRKSSRATTVKNREWVEEQLKEYEIKRAAQPKRDRPTIRALTQQELLAEAAITEEQNKASLETWQQMEADRMQKAKKKTDTGIIGPFVRFYSFMDGEKSKRPKHRKAMVIEYERGRGNVVRPIEDEGMRRWMAMQEAEECGVIGRNLVSFEGYEGDGGGYDGMDDDAVGRVDNLPDDEDLETADLIPLLRGWIERPARPRKPLVCPITGLPARYKDPRTGVPYANKEAYQVIQRIARHEFVWSGVLGAYVQDVGQEAPRGAPEGWKRAEVGKAEGEEDWPEGEGEDVPAWLREKRRMERESKELKERERIKEKETKRSRGEEEGHGSGKKGGEGDQDNSKREEAGKAEGSAGDGPNKKVIEGRESRRKGLRNSVTITVQE